MTQPIPTAKEIVQVFIDKGWRKSTGSTSKNEIRSGRACAVPALLVLAGQEPLKVADDEVGVTLYTEAARLYDMDSSYMWEPFDTPNVRVCTLDARGTRMSEVCRDASIMLDKNPLTCKEEEA